jgi:plasmid stabilization system protein ParE
MTLTVVWTKEAEDGYDAIINYLAVKFTKKEVRNFVKDVDDFLQLLSQNPKLLQKTKKYKNIHRGPINKLTMLIYQVKPQKKELVIISIRSTRRKPK